MRSLRKKKGGKVWYTDWDYSRPFPVELMERFADLPKELRHLIYEYITSWALDEQYARTKVIPGKPINFARRNRVPLYQEVFLPGESYYLNERPNDPKHVPHVQNKFMESCGMLDYYKTSEHDNHIEQQSESGSVMDTRVKVNILNDFLSWYWSSTVVDLRSSYLVSPKAGVYRFCIKWTDPNKPPWNSQAWLRNNPQYHTSITHISLNLDLDLTCSRGSPDHRPGAEGRRSRARMSKALHSSCGTTSVMLPNLKSIILFLLQWSDLKSDLAVGVS
ncbi:hypothetical protein IFR05_001212 [Cadophora sp. M221]|nr:hypothetical protein IFR05_001212 [Cadophora sp. M221]